jgi:hypothetical protein
MSSSSCIPFVVIIVGLPGVGKSHVCDTLRKEHGWQTVDVDRALEDRYGCSQPELLKRLGPYEFENREKTMFVEVAHDAIQTMIMSGNSGFRTAVSASGSCDPAWLIHGPEAMRRSQVYVIWLDTLPLKDIRPTNWEAMGIVPPLWHHSKIVARDACSLTSLTVCRKFMYKANCDYRATNFNDLFWHVLGHQNFAVADVVANLRPLNFGHAW